jgi:hypothetical protein
VPYRSAPDVSFVGDGHTGVATVVNGAWLEDAGTSLGSPVWAAMIALADEERVIEDPSAGTLDGATQTLPALYSLPATDFSEITVGYNDAFSFANTGYYAMPGYNQVTGLGSPIANLLIPDLAEYNLFGLSSDSDVVKSPGATGQTGQNAILDPAPPAGVASAGSGVVTPSGAIAAPAAADAIATAAAPQAELMGALDWVTTTNTAAANPALPADPSTPSSPPPASQTRSATQSEPESVSLHSSVIVSQSAETAAPSRKAERDRRSLIASIDHVLAHHLLSPEDRSSAGAEAHRSTALGRGPDVTVTVANAGSSSSKTAATHYGKFAGRWINQGLPSATYLLNDRDLNRFFVSGRLDDRQASLSATGGLANGSGARIEMTHRRPPLV